jgi:tRNA (guanosine-2'-O-)-methyltransferase
MTQTLTQYLSQYITENKRKKIEEVLNNRTRFLTVIVEDIYQPHNASAVVRTCDCFGVQDIHVIENRNKYQVNPDVTLGSSKWVDIHKYNQKDKNNTELCLAELKSSGYRIYATTPHKNDLSLEEIPLDQKIALIFGNEKEGLSSHAIEMADGYIRIPMFGFTESLNISVCAAICVYHLMNRLWKSDLNWKLSEEEREEIKLRWIKGILKRGNLLEREFFNRTEGCT